VTAEQEAPVLWDDEKVPSKCRCQDILSKSKVKSNYFIVRPKVDQRAGLLSLPHLEIFAIHTR